MKTMFVGSRVVKFRSGVTVMEPIGVFTDKADAERALSEVPQLIADAPPDVMRAFALVGIDSITGAITEVPYVAGAGLVLPG